MAGLVILLVVAMICGTAIWASGEEGRMRRHQERLTSDENTIRLSHEERMAELRIKELQLKVQLASLETPPQLEAPPKETATA